MEYSCSMTIFSQSHSDDGADVSDGVGEGNSVGVAVGDRLVVGPVVPPGEKHRQLGAS